ncbi:hypothetical protein Tco_0652374 [Tanacetum coccineum]|uniref:Reverse transcriptase domain-containing protein n=1 Tax=Tanacetum coccineum TaxID=301880 RepID=A0ABQ4WXT1_9ASTR
MGIAEDVIVKVENFSFLSDFVIVDFEADPRVPIILRRPFLFTARALVDLYEEKLTLRVENEEVKRRAVAVPLLILIILLLYEHSYLDTDNIAEAGAIVALSARARERVAGGAGEFSLPNMIAGGLDISIDLFPPADKSAFFIESFAMKLTHIRSSPSMIIFNFESEARSRDFTRVLKNIYWGVCRLLELMKQ